MTGRAVGPLGLSSERSEAVDRGAESARLRPGSHWLAALVAACVLSGCATINEAPVVELSTAAGTSDARGMLGEHVVAAGETMYGIAFRHGLDYRALAVWNGIDPPFTIRPGQRLRLDAPAVTNAAEVARVSGQPVDEMSLESGSARTYALGSAPVESESALAVEVIDSGSSVQRGDTAAVSTHPARSSESMVPPAAPPQSSSAPAGPLSAAVAGTATRGTPATTTPNAPAVLTVPATIAPDPQPLPAGPTQSVGGVAWRWPALGQVIGRFAPGDPARQGIDVQGTEGAPVVAAAAGEVVYSGNGLVGYGELVIIKHSSEFLSAYGHNRKRLVAEGTRVAAGQQIAEMGKANGALNVLHFEIRRAGKPVDPLSILPRR